VVIGDVAPPGFGLPLPEPNLEINRKGQRGFARFEEVQLVGQDFSGGHKSRRHNRRGYQRVEMIELPRLIPAWPNIPVPTPLPPTELSREGFVYIGPQPIVPMINITPIEIGARQIRWIEHGINPIPEPGTLSLVLLGGGLFAYATRRSSHRR
jgi:hypothetical protein